MKCAYNPLRKSTFHCVFRIHFLYKVFPDKTLINEKGLSLLSMKSLTFTQSEVSFLYYFTIVLGFFCLFVS